MSDEITFFAETNFRNQRRRFGIKTRDRRQHFYVIGKTGVGKTTLLENMAIQDIQNGKGVGIIDPHGEFAQKMLNYVPSHRINDVIYFNPADINYPIAFNVIEKVDLAHRHLVASGLIGVFKKIWAESWGPRLEYVLRNAILALLEYPGSTLLGIMRILTDKAYRQKVVDNVQDPVVKSFWLDEFAKYPDRFMAEAISPIQNKVGQFLTSALMRNIVGQTKSSIDIRKVMDEKKILIVNLSKGLVGEDNSALLGAMLITRIQLAAMSRVDMPENERNDFYLYVDEFQNFATEAFANILSEARKYRLNLILAHQYITQMEEKVRDAVFGNVGTLVSFRVGAYDAEYMEKEFAPSFMAQDLVNLEFANIYLKLMIDGLACQPFSAITLPPLIKPEKSCAEKIIKVSREKYTSQRSEVEDKIIRWSGFGSEENNKEEKNSASAESRELKIKPKKKDSFGEAVYPVVCWSCKENTAVKFKPDPQKPVYCPDCLKKVRKGEIPEPTAAPGPNGDSGAEKIGPVSLKDAIKKEPMVFHSQKKRKEVDLKGLREALKESMKEKEK